MSPRSAAKPKPSSKLSPSKQSAAPERRHHLDRRAATLLAVGKRSEPEPPKPIDDDDELLSTRQVADWLGVSPQWVVIGRGKKNYGPKFVRIGHRRIVYRKDDVRAWLKARTHSSTSEYVR